MRTDEAYLALLKKDPQEGMAQIIEAFTPVVWAVCARYLPQEEDVRECVNDTFTEFWLQRERFAPEKGSLRSWLAMLARRRAIDRWRRQSRYTALPLEEDAPAPQGLSPDEKMDLEAALSKLSEEDAALLRMKYFEGLSAKEIAARLGLPYETVKKRQQRTLEKLRKSMLVAFVIALLALLVACGWAVLRYFGILPGYGVNTDAETPFYILTQEASAENGTGTVTVTDAALRQGELRVSLQLARGPDTDAFVRQRQEEASWKIDWYDALLTLSGYETRLYWEGGEATYIGLTAFAPGLTADGDALPAADAAAYDLYFTCEAPDTGAPMDMTLDLGWVQVAFTLAPGKEDALEAYSYALAEYGGVLAIPALEDGRLIVDLYPLNTGEFSVGAGIVQGVYEHNGGPSEPVTIAGSDGAVRTGRSVRYNPYGESAYSRWDFGPAEPGSYTLHIPYVYLSAPLPEEFAVPLPEGGGPWQAPGGSLYARVSQTLPEGVVRVGVSTVVMGETDAPQSVDYYVFFTAEPETETLALAGLNLFAQTDAEHPDDMLGQWASVAALYDESGQEWKGLCGSFHAQAAAASPRLAAVQSGIGGMSGARAEICYRWNQSFDIELRVE